MKIKPEDFESHWPEEEQFEAAFGLMARIVNDKLPEIKKRWKEELLKDARTVYHLDQSLEDGQEIWRRYPHPHTNHLVKQKAKLVSIETLERSDDGK